MTACPVEAIHKREEDGIVVVDREKCVGRDMCGYPCTHGCPAGNDVQGFVSLIRAGKYAEAWRLLVENNPFPGVCGRVCFHPCESACNRGQIDMPVGIHMLERFASEHIHTVPPFAVDRKKQRVAIVGSGPAGLSCAYHLARRGYRVTVFEALPVAGGMPRVGIPEYRLPMEVVEREVAFIESLGVEIKTNMRVGQNLTIEELEQFDAVFLAVGAHKEKAMDLPGIGLNGVVRGIDFLRKVRLDGNVSIGKKVVVLGGGHVAFDCTRTARRLGAAEVHLVYRRDYQDMPVEPSEIRQGTEEGIIVHTSSLACKILGGSEEVTGVECMDLRSWGFDTDGTFKFEAVEGSETVLEADTVILAIGQEPDLSFLPEKIRVNKGVIQADENGATSHPKYFAGGDAVFPGGRVAGAIGAGRKAALSIDRMLKGLSEEEPGEGHPVFQFKLIDTDFIKKKDRVLAPELPPSDRLTNFAEVETDLGQEQAKTEADRCLLCRGMCRIACPYNAPQFGAEDNPKMQKCNFCLEEWAQGKKPICVRSCTMRALDAGLVEELRAEYGGIKEAEGFSFHEKTEPAIFLKSKRPLRNR